MILKFRSKAQMNLYVPMQEFERWPEDTFSFCPKCSYESFELLYENESEAYIRCHLCNALWIIKSSAGNIRNGLALA